MVPGQTGQRRGGGRGHACLHSPENQESQPVIQTGLGKSPIPGFMPFMPAREQPFKAPQTEELKPTIMTYPLNERYARLPEGLVGLLSNVEGMVKMTMSTASDPRRNFLVDRTPAIDSGKPGCQRLTAGIR